VKYRFIEEHRRPWPVRLMCRLLQVSPGGYYTWRDRPTRACQQRRETLVVEIQAIYQEFKERYGSLRIHKELRARGQDGCVNSVAKLLRQQGIAAKTKRQFRGTTDSDHDRPVADNILDRQFEPSVVKQSWVADIT
jgi:putative transposase